jgi:D-alanyl-lipoteichoic acid acyltransferase DltB (MBOAT superfamily)
MKVRNTFIIFLVSGFWHGANWTFLVWGLLNAIYFLPLLLSKTNRNNIGTVAEGRNFPTIRELISMGITFSLTVFAWIFFRAKDMSHAINYIKGIFNESLFSKPQVLPAMIFILIVFFIVIEWMGRENQYALQCFGIKWPKLVRLSFYYVLILMIFLFMGKEQEFIYFQF